MPEAVAVDQCTGCSGPGKVVWPASATRPQMHHAAVGEWYDLVLCQDCGRLWVQAPYEPFASFIYLIAWPHSRRFFHRVVGLEHGSVIAHWCDYKIRTAWPTMSDQDRLAVQNHRNRSYGRNPIDEAPSGEETDPLEPLLRETDSSESKG